ncbi:MAG: CocE/NonD family hydrolase [Actinomycetota bacterium]|nr:CocE/NonD family hydrolase [Actinomycetota bacterium]
MPAATGRTAPTAYTSTNLTITASDGVALAATLKEPVGASARLPAILLLHGIGQKRQDFAEIANRFAAAGFAVLSPDARGHGQSGGLVSVDGPREIQDVRELVTWLRARPEIDAQHVGGWGISLGGGAILRALGEGVPFAAVETLETWTNLYTALLPQNLSKSGMIVALLNSVPEERLSPEIKAIRSDALASANLPKLRQFGAQRSSLQLLSKVTTPVFMLQGRRDFAFDIAQAKAGFAAVKGPKRLYIGTFGHAPSTFPGPDVDVVVNEGIRWFKRYLLPQGSGVQPRIQVAADPWTGTPATLSRYPALRTSSWTLPGISSIGGQGKDIRISSRTKTRLETFGSATVRLTARLSGGWSRIVAVLTATRGKKTTVVSEGGINTAGMSGRRTLAIRLLDDATLIPRGSRLTLTLAASSTAQDPGNALYLDIPMAPSARVTLSRVTLKLPVLKQPISR